MFCPKCGTSVPDNGKFCPKCGEPISQGSQGSAAPASAYGMQNSGAQVNDSAYGAQQVNTQQGMQPAPYMASAPAGNASASVVYARGCLGSAWDDVKQTDGWFGKGALLALINMVPILNFVVSGYGYKWGADVVRGKNEPLPKKIVDGDNFKLGFYICVVGLVAGLVLGIEGALLGLIPILGVIAAFVLAVFAQMYLVVNYLRVALFDDLGAGFSVGNAMNAFKRQLGSLFCLSFVPGLIAAVISSLLIFVALFIFGAVFGASVLPYANGMSYYSSSYQNAYYIVSSLLGGAGVFGIIILLVASYLCEIAAVICGLVTQRAAGYYIARYAPEWKAEVEARRYGYAGAPVAQPYSPYAQGQGVQPQQYEAGAYSSGAVAPAVVSQQTQASRETLADLARQAQSASATTTNPASGPLQGGVSAYEPIVDSSETSVLTEQELAGPGETVVAPEAQVRQEREPVVSQEAQAAPATQQPAVQQPVVQQPAAQAPTSEPDTTELHVEETANIMSWGGTVGEADDSGTVVLSAQPSEVAFVLTRANGDQCQVTLFPTVIGKGSDADLIIPDNPIISRSHVRILRDGDVFAAEDLGSTNKTFIDSYELPPHQPTILTDGNDLILGNEVLHVTIG